jgi:hypothetical protein
LQSCGNFIVELGIIYQGAKTKTKQKRLQKTAAKKQKQKQKTKTAANKQQKKKATKTKGIFAFRFYFSLFPQAVAHSNRAGPKQE